MTNAKVNSLSNRNLAFELIHEQLLSWLRYHQVEKVFKPDQRIPALWLAEITKAKVAIHTLCPFYSVNLLSMLMDDVFFLEHGQYFPPASIRPFFLLAIQLSIRHIKKVKDRCCCSLPRNTRYEIIFSSTVRPSWVMHYIPNSIEHTGALVNKLRVNLASNELF